MKRYFLIALIASLSHAAKSDLSSAASASPPQQDLKSVRQEINTLKKDIAQKQHIQREAQSAIKQSEQAISQTKQTLVTLGKKQNYSQQQLAKLREQINTSHQRVNKVQQNVGAMLARQYKNGQHDAMQMVMNASDPNQSARDLTYYQHIVSAQQQLVSRLIKQQQDLGQLSAQLEQELLHISQLSDRKSNEKVTLEQGKTNQQQQLRKIAGEIQVGQTKLSQLQEDEKRLSRLIAQINRDIQRRQAEASRQARQEAADKENVRRRKLAATAKQQGKPVPEEAKKTVRAENIEHVADSSNSGRSFASLQGKMKLPVSGKIIGRFGKARQEGNNWKGLFISTTVGQAVHSVADGSIVYAGALRGFGNAIIIDHGGNYMTVYTGLSVIAKTSGSQLKAGDTIGNTGTLDSGEAGLYFEIRHMGQPLNPQAWAS
ncbi:peptidoglycan DD-metalloendopeptidase family protein [Neisseriaceae bacterium TC5R-5]|nr:peptidoglycan DD-metalloendopeptidase family protein [Neisseriaceae bacterium TC5R-5]